jgi:hypothetical protein
METIMKKTTVIGATLLLVASTAVGLAGPKSKGASEFSPGDQMRDQGTKTAKGNSHQQTR